MKAKAVRLVIRPFLVVIKYVLLVVFSLALLLYLNSYWYEFHTTERFKGNILYNPYQHVQFNRGMMSNFHSHSECWNALTNGKGSEDEVKQTYRNMGYDLYELSNYHRLDHAGRNNLQTYEHGWGFLKAHQLVIGGSNVTWLDFPLVQNANQKQTILNRLNQANSDALIVIAHPSLRGAYSQEDIISLTGFHCLEVINKLKKSKKLWDDVLSGGKYIPAMGGDDCHNIFKNLDIGRCGNYVLTSNPAPAAVKGALRNGRSLIVEFDPTADAAIDAKRELIQKPMPIKGIQCAKDTITFTAHESLRSVLVITDYSDTLYSAHDVNGLSFVLPESSSFVRFEWITIDGRHIYSNPIARTEKGSFPVQQSAFILPFKTMFYRLLLVVGICILWYPSLILLYVFIAKKISGRPKWGKPNRRAFPPFAWRFRNIAGTGK
jgi:hypothetical protein